MAQPQGFHRGSEKDCVVERGGRGRYDVTPNRSFRAPQHGLRGGRFLCFVDELLVKSLKECAEISTPTCLQDLGMTHINGTSTVFESTA